MVHVRTSRHHDVKERIQHELGIIAHLEIWCAEDWLELRTSRSRWHACCTPQITKKKITSRGKYKEHVLSRYHRSTQNRNQYILNNNIKLTTILNKWITTNNMNIDNNTIVGTPSITISSTPMRTHASTPYIFGKWAFWNWL